ncbi:putative Co-chaperone protein [Podospora conica]|nr:putative Co-chaperone protein [Schizothecium conicum]
MRRSIPLPSGRATTWVCAVCRNQTPTARRALFSTATAPSQLPTTSRPTTASPRTLPPPPSAARRWLSSSPTAPPQDSSTEQPPKPLPYYALFPKTLPHGPPPSGPFEIDIPTLRREFLRLQAQSHPDLHHHHHHTSPSSTTGGRKTRREAEATSSEINAAFKTLCSPLLRAEYILRERHGVDLAGDESTGPGEDPEVLMTVLEAREAIDAAAEEGELEGVRRENEERVAETEGRLGEALGRGDVEAARRECVRLRYWLGIREGVEGWERGRGGGVLHH